MKTSKEVTLIFNYRRASTYAIHVVLGALETSPDLQGVEVKFANDASEIAIASQEAVEAMRTVVVAWSFYSPDFAECRDSLRDLKLESQLPGILHLAGGVHASAEPEQTLRAGFDFAAVGEGETIIREFIRALLHGEDPSKTKGICYLKDGVFVSNGSSERVDLNDYPPFATKHHRFNPIEITRGCMYACKFCQTPFMFKARFRHRTVENICHYVRIMKEHHLKDVRFITPTSLSYGSSSHLIDIGKIEELLSSVRATLGNEGRIFFGTFPSEVRPEHVSAEVLAVLKKYVANNNLIIGGQSGSQRILDLSHRGHLVEEIVTAVRLSLEAGFIPNVDFIFGLPGEIASDVKASLQLAEDLTSLGARVHGHTFMPLPGTPYKNAAPGRIGSTAKRQLERLKSRGKLYGQWEKQIALGQTLASLAKSKGTPG